MCIGKGEETFIEVIEQNNTKNFSKIHGLCYIENGQVAFTPERINLKSLDELDFPARHLLPEEDFIFTEKVNFNFSKINIIFKDFPQ